MRMYFIALLLPDVLNERIRTFKEYMREHYGCTVALRSPAHITIIPPFWMDEEMEGRLLNELGSLSSRFISFDIHHEGFSSFPQRTIFIDVPVSRELADLHKEVNDHFRQRPDFRMKFDERPFHPHVTVATRDLTKRSYQEAFAHFKSRKFSENWACGSISLLRLSEVGWQVIGQATFGA